MRELKLRAVPEISMVRMGEVSSSLKVVTL